MKKQNTWKFTKILKVTAYIALNDSSFGIWYYKVNFIRNIFFILGQGEVKQEE